MFDLQHSSMHIPLLVPDLPDAQALMPWLSRIDATRQYTNFGPLVQEFEQALCEYLRSDADMVNVVTLNSGTAALELCIAALGLPSGASVLMPAFTFPATAIAAKRNGLVPLFSDVDADTWRLTPEIAYAVLRQQPISLVVPVATFGCPIQTAAWDAFTSDTGIPVLIDAAAAFGNQEVGQLTHVAFSFHATKPFGIGEGGALATNSLALAQRVRQLSNFGFQTGLVRNIGSNAKLSEYAAAVALAQWERRPQQQILRSVVWSQYERLLKDCSEITLQKGFALAQLPAALVVTTHRPAQELARDLANRGIETRRWYCPPLQSHPAFADCPSCGPHGGNALPVTDLLTETTLGLPWFCAMTVAQCADVVHAMQSLLEATNA